MDLATIGLAALGGPVTVDLQDTDGKTTIYTVPVGYAMVPFAVLLKNPTASLAGGTEFDLGDGAACTTWLQDVDLHLMIATTDFRWITSNNIKYTVYDAGDAFGIIPVTGATADAQATAILLGMLFAV